MKTIARASCSWLLLAVLIAVALGSGDGRFSFTGAGIKDPRVQNLPAVWETAPAVVVH